MKHAIVFLLLLCTGYAKAQNQISGIVITMPANMPAATADWASVLPPVSITAQTKPDSNRSIPPEVIESKVLVTIKNGGSKVCGSYTATNAPFAGFNSLVRNWRGGEVEQLLGQTCTLQPGSYTLCVQFYNNGVAISEERCKPFMVKGEENGTTPGTGNISYTGPEAISPADGAVLNEKDAQQPITFRWTPVVPKPKRRPTYMVRVFEVPEGQTGASAIKTNSPIFEEEVTDVTMLIKKLNLNIGSSVKTNNSKYAWYVEAKDFEGKSYGVSGVNVFSVSSGGCQISYDAKIDSMRCIDYNHVKVCGTFYCIKSGYGPPAGYAVYTTHINSATLYALPSNTVVGTNTTLGNVAEGSNISVCLSTSAIPAGTTNFRLKFDLKTNDPVNNCINIATADTTVPNCACNPCKNKRTRLITDSTNYTNNTISSFFTITHSPVKVIKVSAQIVDFERLGEAGCLKCTKDSKEFGNYTGGSLNGNGGQIVNAPNGYGKQIQWQFTTPTSVIMNNCDLQMAVPPLTEVSCCKDSIRFCTRWSFTDENCVTCDTLICTVVVRQYKAPSPIIWNPSSYGAQMARMGEPFNSWYKQESKEFPKNFDEQVEALFQKNAAVKEAEIKKEVFVEKMKTAFYQIQALKSSSAGDAVWNAISGNPLNTQCGGGNFETGLVNFSEWSGAHGSIGSTNDPILGLYTTGFSPVGVGLNNPMTASNNHSIVSKTNDGIVGAALSTTATLSNNYSFRLGNSIVGCGSEILSKKFIVTGSGVIRFLYSIVAHAAHTNSDAPSFNVLVYDNSGALIPGKVFLDAASILPLEKVVSPATADPFWVSLGGHKYKSWTCAKIDLSDYIGKTVSVALITTDCAQCGHYGYAYIDDWCGNCDGASSGSVNIQPIQDSCIKQGTQICVKYTLPKGSTTGTGTIKLQFYQNGNPIVYNMTSPTLTTDGTYCFTINPASLPCANGVQGYDVVATGTFTLGSATVVVTSPDPVGTAGNVEGIKPGKNNDLVCCGTLADKCCDNFVKTVTTTTTILGTAATGYTAIKFVPTFKAGPKPIKQIRISILNFETNSTNKECLTCQSNANSYGVMSVPQGWTGSGKDAIEGMVYPTDPLTMACFPIPCPTWRTGKLTHEVIWGSNSGPGYDLMDGAGDQSTTFTVTVPKKSTLICCDDTVTVCVKYSFTDVDCQTCDTVICYKIINRQTVSQAKSTFNKSIINLNKNNLGNKNENQKLKDSSPEPPIGGLNPGGSTTPSTSVPTMNGKASGPYHECPCCHEITETIDHCEVCGKDYSPNKPLLSVRWGWRGGWPFCVRGGFFCRNVEKFSDANLDLKALEENETTGSATIEIKGTLIRIISIAEKGAISKELMAKFADRKILPEEDEVPADLLELLFRSSKLNYPKKPVVFKSDEQQFQVVNTKDNTGKAIKIIEVYQKTKISIDGKEYSLIIITTSGKGSGSPKNAGF